MNRTCLSGMVPSSHAQCTIIRTVGGMPIPAHRKRRKTAFLGGFSKKGGPSDRIRTCGILLPKQARYQLRYTRLFSFLSGWSYSPKPPALPAALHPVIRFLLSGNFSVCGHSCGQRRFRGEFPTEEKARKQRRCKAFRHRCGTRFGYRRCAPKPPALPTALHPEI